MAAMNVRRIGETDRAGEVAGLVDLDDGKAAMLFVIRAKAAVEGTASLGPGLGLQRPVAWLEPQFLLAPIVDVVADQDFLYAVGQASLEIPDLLILDDDLGGDRFETGLAQRCRLIVENVGRGLAGRGVNRRERIRCRLAQDFRVATR